MSEIEHSPSSASLSEGGHYVRDRTQPLQRLTVRGGTLCQRLDTAPPATHCQRGDTMSETEHSPSSDSLSEGDSMSETEHSPSRDSLSEGGQYVRD